MNYLIIVLGLFFAQPSIPNNELTITISNIKNIEGNIEIGLFNSGDRFLESGQAFRKISVPVKKDSHTVVIKDLPKGEYAISLYHDKNSNGVCDRNFFGIPKEPYGFSNNYRPKFSAPAFVDCKFELDSDQSLNIELIN